jgi:hypothetical protein
MHVTLSWTCLTGKNVAKNSGTPSLFIFLQLGKTLESTAARCRKSSSETFVKQWLTSNAAYVMGGEGYDALVETGHLK